MLTQAEIECLTSCLSSFESDAKRAEPIGRLVATWLLSGVHAKESGVWMASPLSNSVDGNMTGFIPESYQTMPSPDLVVRHAVRFIRWTIKTEDPELHPDALKIVRRLMQAEPTSFRQLTTHKLERLSSELEDLFAQSRNHSGQTKSTIEVAQLDARLANKKCEYLEELASLERLECARMEAGELIAGSVQLPERGTHLDRYSNFAHEAESRGELGAALLLTRYKYRAAYYFADYIQSLLSGEELSEEWPAYRNLHERVEAFKGTVILNRIESLESQERLLKHIFGASRSQEPS
jgi:hypothetical protein